MTRLVTIADYDVIYLSYDEPNAEKNYADLLTKIPWAKRVHGVEGSDAAHKACANLSETDRFITVDGDNQIYNTFIDSKIEIPEDADFDNSVISWCGKNIINGLTYGNGGLKCWPKKFVLSMRTHENADPDNLHAQVDFCWDVNYFQQKETYSIVHNNTTPQQAWRAGFREGVKLALDRGEKVGKKEFLTETHWRCLHMLYIWTMVGSDVDHGMWAILGARAGLAKTMCTDWDYIKVRDFEYLNTLWISEFKDLTNDEVYDNCLILGKQLIDDLEIPIALEPLAPEQSKFFKTVYQNPTRTHANVYAQTETK